MAVETEFEFDLVFALPAAADEGALIDALYAALASVAPIVCAG